LTSGCFGHPSRAQHSKVLEKTKEFCQRQIGSTLSEDGGGEEFENILEVSISLIQPIY
jgi:Fe-S cluster biogenesis protein NfuA